MSTLRQAPIPLAMIGGGFGSAVGITHRDVAGLDGRFELRAGVFSPDHDRCKAFGETLRLDPERCYATVDAMLAAEAGRPDGIGAAVIVTPNAFHFDAARACLARGLHVICEKPITTTLDDAKILRDLARSEGRVLALAHGYCGYAMVHQARALVADGAIGQVVEVQAEYASGWGQELAEVAAELSTLVEGRSADDNAHVMLRFDNGARGMLWATMAAAGAGNGLRLRVYGRAGHLEWSQEVPETLTLRPIDGPIQVYRRAMPGAPVADALSRRRPGQPEGIVEAFANIYRGVAEAIGRVDNGKAEIGDRHSALVFLNGDDGVAGLAFIEAVVASSGSGGRWTDVSR